MRTYIGCGILLVLSLGIGLTQISAGQTTKSTSIGTLRPLGNGEWWATLSDDVKDTFVDGYATAMVHANHIVVGMCKQKAKELQPNNANGGQFNSEFNGALDLCIVGGFFDFDVDKHQLRNGIDDFYSDPQNTRISIHLAFAYANDKAQRKKSAKELRDELQGWRRDVAR